MAAKPKAKVKTKAKAVPTPSVARRRLFVAEYLIDLNQTQAAIRTGYSRKTAKQQASRLLTFVDVQEGIAEGMAARSKRTEIDADKVVRELAKVGFASMRNFITIDAQGQPVINMTDTDADSLDALSEISTETVMERVAEGEASQMIRKTRIKLHDKLRALQSLAEHTGVFKKSDQNKADALAAAFADIWARGSKAPIKRQGGDE